MTDSFSEVFGNKNKVLVVFSHPDDAEIYSGGTIAKLISLGKEVRVVKMTNGNKGSGQENISASDLENTRLQEDQKAMKILGIKDENNIYLNINDGEVEDNMATIELLVKQIREFRPDIIITHNPEDVIIRYGKNENWINHRDHMNTGKAVSYAAYPYSRDTLFFPEQLKDPKYQSHSTTQFLYVDYYGHEDEIFIEVTDFVETRDKAILAHESQYNSETTKSITELMTSNTDGKNYERFRYVVAD
jgi:LmbE family N-acetylglucosaminyl deacetylase